MLAGLCPPQRSSSPLHRACLLGLNLPTSGHVHWPVLLHLIWVSLKGPPCPLLPQLFSTLICSFVFSRAENHSQKLPFLSLVVSCLTTRLRAPPESKHSFLLFSPQKQRGAPGAPQTAVSRKNIGFPLPLPGQSPSLFNICQFAPSSSGLSDPHLSIAGAPC